MDYLLEIGTEELPYGFIPQAIKQLEENFESFFKSNNIEFEKIDVLATPRRLAVIIKKISEKQPDEEKVIKGPPKKVAYDENGNLTQAGIGFLNKNQVEEKNTYLEDDYLYVRVFSKGKVSSVLLEENVPSIVLKLQGPHFMRWSDFNEKFSRPIRWIVSLLDNKEIPVQIVNVKSSKFSKGHRFSGNLNVEIKHADEYIEKLREANVIVDQKERKKIIAESAKKEADKLNAQVIYDEELLEEVTYLCEYPVPVVCDFDEKYLEIPEKVTVTVMASHQRYFALYKEEKLLNKFITIANFIGDDFSNIKAGNERVIVARLDDAIFFFNEDTKKPFESYVESLKGVTFQKGMGSVYDKTQRIISLSKELANNLEINSYPVERTALLCKADLTTNLVFEFTELQGFIGADYARKSGEDEKVCKGIKEHYFPLNAESELAEGIEGQIVGIADKVDTICAVFANGKIPTGSSDPLGIRRAALGVIKTIITKYLNINLSQLIKNSVELLPVQVDSYQKIEEFFIQRLSIFLSDNCRKDVLDACLSNKNPLVDLCDFVQRVRFISEQINSPDFLKVSESANRISRILKKPVEKGVLPNLFVEESESELFTKIQQIDESNYEKLFMGFVKANPAIEKFFDNVLVMDKDDLIKENRLAMLTMLSKKYNLIADFSTLQI